MSATATITRQVKTFVPSLAAIGAGLLVLGAVFLPECRAAVRVWIDSTAYGHCFLVIPIALYLAWDRRATVAGLLPAPAPLFLLLGLPLPFAWFVAERLGIMEGRQLVAIAFVELLFLVVLGWRLFISMLGPFLYLVFLVPFGAFVTPALQAFTARFIDVGLTVLGIPHFANEMVIEITAGTFYVAEACAGLRFLIASVAFGVFYALINYSSPGRRAGFIAASIIVPVIANGFRALGIVFLGHVLGSAEAAAADHIIYGWLFFSIVTLLLVAAGLPFRQAPAPARIASPDTSGPAAAPWPALAAVVLAAIAPAAALALDRSITPAVLAGRPEIVAPDGCTKDGPASETADHVSATLYCSGRNWTVTFQAVSARSTGAGLGEAKARLLGPQDPDGVSVSALHGVPGNAGNWQVTISQEPGQISGTAIWVHGRPAGGGLSQRLAQARDSVFGNTSPPLIVMISSHSPRSMRESEVESMTGMLARIITAQPDLDAQAARLTGTSSPPPPT